MILKKQRKDPVTPGPQSPLHPAVLAYLRKIKALSRDYQPSLFWERQLSGLRRSADYEKVEKIGGQAIQMLIASMGYGFSDLADDIRKVDEDPAYRNALMLADVLETQAKTVTIEGSGSDKDTWEHARALSFLRRAGILSDYIRFISPLRIRSNMSIARHYFYAREIAGTVRDHLGSGPLRILEIGAGAGNLAVFLQRMGLAGTYCIVDLPEMLMQSSYTMSVYVPGATLLFEYEASGARQPLFFFLPPQDIAQIPDAAFDLCLNFNSFAEMDPQMIDTYFALIYRASRRGALFYNVNRRQRLPQRGARPVFDNNPLLYPYKHTDRILRWEDESFQQTTRSLFGLTPSLAILRAALINLP